MYYVDSMASTGAITFFYSRVAILEKRRGGIISFLIAALLLFFGLCKSK